MSHGAIGLPLACALLQRRSSVRRFLEAAPACLLRFDSHNVCCPAERGWAAAARAPRLRASERCHRRRCSYGPLPEALRSPRRLPYLQCTMADGRCHAAAAL